jgi:hypothetical protein
MLTNISWSRSNVRLCSYKPFMSIYIYIWRDFLYIWVLSFTSSHSWGIHEFNPVVISMEFLVSQWNRSSSFPKYFDSLLPIAIPATLHGLRCVIGSIRSKSVPTLDFNCDEDLGSTQNEANDVTLALHFYVIRWTTWDLQPLSLRQYLSQQQFSLWCNDPEKYIIYEIWGYMEGTSLITVVSEEVVAANLG